MKSHNQPNNRIYWLLLVPIAVLSGVALWAVFAKLDTKEHFLKMDIAINEPGPACETDGDIGGTSH